MCKCRYLGHFFWCPDGIGSFSSSWRPQGPRNWLLLCRLWLFLMFVLKFGSCCGRCWSSGLLRVIWLFGPWRSSQFHQIHQQCHIQVVGYHLDPLQPLDAARLFLCPTELLPVSRTASAVTRHSGGEFTVPWWWRTFQSLSPGSQLDPWDWRVQGAAFITTIKQSFEGMASLRPSDWHSSLRSCRVVKQRHVRLIYLISKVLMIRRGFWVKCPCSAKLPHWAPQKQLTCRKCCKFHLSVLHCLRWLASGSVQNAAPDHECTKPRHFGGLWYTSSFLVVWTSVPFRLGDSKWPIQCSKEITRSYCKSGNC